MEGTEYPVTISDDSEALQAAYAAGGAIIGVWEEQAEREGRRFDNCLYLVTDPADADEAILKRVVCRRLGLPWIIGETKRLLIREFCHGDPLEPEAWAEGPEGEERLVFCSPDSRKAYIESQYRFCESGLWALVEKETGAVIGKAGITGKELGYHIYPPYRRQGFALEACREIIRYGREEMGLKKLTLKVAGDNPASAALAGRLGFAEVSCRGDMAVYEINV